MLLLFYFYAVNKDIMHVYGHILWLQVATTIPPIINLQYWLTWETTLPVHHFSQASESTNLCWTCFPTRMGLCSWSIFVCRGLRFLRTSGMVILRLFSSLASTGCFQFGILFNVSIIRESYLYFICTCTLWKKQVPCHNWSIYYTRCLKRTGKIFLWVVFHLQQLGEVLDGTTGLNGGNKGKFMNVDIWLWVNKDMWIVSVTTVKATRGQPRGIMNYLE